MLYVLSPFVLPRLKKSNILAKHVHVLNAPPQKATAGIVVYLLLEIIFPWGFIAWPLGCVLQSWSLKAKCDTTGAPSPAEGKTHAGARSCSFSGFSFAMPNSVSDPTNTDLPRSTHKILNFPNLDELTT